MQLSKIFIWGLFKFRQSQVKIELQAISESVSSSEIMDVDSKDVVSEAINGIFDWSCEISVDISFKLNSGILIRLALVLPNETSVGNISAY